MFVLIISFIIITTVQGDCSNHTCVYGQCMNDACKCDPGIRGDTCNMDIIDCDTESCFNNGACIELVNGFACECLPDFSGPRCQHSRTKTDHDCKKKCSNNGKCVMINNIEKCLCTSKYTGSKCESLLDNTNNLSKVPKCSVLRFRNNFHEGRCLAIGLTPLFDVQCNCRYDELNKQFIICHITPSPYSKQKCSIRRPISVLTLSTLPDPMSAPVCPVNWRILDQYEKTREIVSSVHVTRCQLI